MNLIVLTAPSGAGKTTIARRLMAEVPGLRFSVSATTRPPREGERNGVDYFFLQPEAFQSLIEEDGLVEYEEVYPGRYYGTLREQLEQAAIDAAEGGGGIVLDIDVKGALNVKRLFGEDALTLFIAPPSLGALADRLRQRGTEADDRIQVRLDRAEMEMDHADRFDQVVVNDDLETAVGETIAAVRAFLARERPA
ncbi:MAG TPA: guanylate kinase [Bacteroidetes bacterium]|nr:guanylate kinase [Bacteroidota bacterium]HIL57548.1 guanylate kinase [Rhodothermales bacterium]